MVLIEKILIDYRSPSGIELFVGRRKINFYRDLLLQTVEKNNKSIQ